MEWSQGSWLVRRRMEFVKWSFLTVGRTVLECTLMGALIPTLACWRDSPVLVHSSTASRHHSHREAMGMFRSWSPGHPPRGARKRRLFVWY